MKTLNSKPAGVTNISDGHVLRQIRQLALRGNVRNYDEHGVCGKMRLVIACEPKRFMSNVHLLFPGVRNIKLVGGADDNATMQTKVLNVLSNAQQSIRDPKGDQQSGWERMAVHSALRSHIGFREERSWLSVGSIGTVGAAKAPTLSV